MRGSIGTSTHFTRLNRSTKLRDKRIKKLSKTLGIKNPTSQQLKRLKHIDRLDFA